MPASINDLVAAARARVREVSPQQVAAWPAGSVAIIDVREADEYAAGHLPGAVNIPRGVLEFRIHAHPALACSTSQELTPPPRGGVFPRAGTYPAPTVRCCCTA